MRPRSRSRRVYDATLQPLAGADIGLTLRDSAGTSYDYRFSSTPSSATVWTPDASPGHLPLDGRTTLAGTDYDRSGTFEIRASNWNSTAGPQTTTSC